MTSNLIYFWVKTLCCCSYFFLLFDARVEQNTHEWRKKNLETFLSGLFIELFFFSLLSLLIFGCRNDKFADVLLFTSQMDGGCGIPAHKIILSSCSHVRIYSFVKSLIFQEKKHHQLTSFSMASKCLMVPFFFFSLCSVTVFRTSI